MALVFGDLAPGRKSSLALRAADLSGDGFGKGNVEEVGIITGVAFSDDPALFTRSKPVRLRTSRSEVREAIAEWRRYNPNRNLLGIDCTALVENPRSSVVRHTP